MKKRVTATLLVLLILLIATLPVGSATLLSHWPLNGTLNDFGTLNNDLLNKTFQVTYTADRPLNGLSQPVVTSSARFNMSGGIINDTSGSYTQYDNDNFSLTLWFNASIFHDNSENTRLIDFSRASVPEDLRSIFVPQSDCAASPTCWLQLQLVDSGGTSHNLKFGQSSASDKFDVSTWYFVAVTYDEVTDVATAYVNGVQVNQSDLGTFTMAGSINKVAVGYRGVSNSEQFNGSMADVRYYSEVLNTSAVSNLYTCSSFDCGDLSPRFQVSVFDNLTTSAVASTSVTFTFPNSTAFTLTNNTGNVVETHILTNESQTLDILVTSPGYYSRLFDDYVASADLSTSLNRTDIAASYSGNVSNGSVSFVRSLRVNASVSQCGGTNTLLTLINGQSVGSTAFTCGSTNQSNVSLTYTPVTEGLFNISLRANGSGVTSFTTANLSFVADVSAPSVVVNFTFTEGFISSGSASAQITCTDTAAVVLRNELVHNGSVLINATYENGTVQSNSTTVVDGQNVLTGICRDYVSSSSTTLNQTIFFKGLFLWDERENVPFDITNLSEARVWFEDNSSYYDLIANNRNNITFLSQTASKIRVDLQFMDGTLISRQFDLSLFPSLTDLLICANKDDVTYYQQRLISSSERQAIVKNSFIDCYIAGDYTRFAFSNSLILNAYTIDSFYTIQTVNDDGVTITLASIDGREESNINLDVLLFNLNAFRASILDEQLSVQNLQDLTGGNSTALVRYENADDDNTQATLTIIRESNGMTVFSSSDWSDPNDFAVVFDYSTLGVNSSEIFRATVNTVKSNGDTDSITVWFNTKAVTGVLPALAVFAVMVLLTLFGLTLASVDVTFNYFGVFILAASIIVGSFAIGEWYVLLWQIINLVGLAYVVIVMAKRNEVFG